MPTRNINLTEYYDRFVEKQVDAGKFRNASEVMRAGLRLLDQQVHEEQAKLKLLRSLAAEGFDQIDQGKGVVVKDERQLADLIGNLGRRAAKRASQTSSRN